MGGCCSRENALAVVTNSKIDNHNLSNIKYPLSNNFTTNNISSNKVDFITPLSKKEESNYNYFNLKITFEPNNVENLQLMNKTSQHMDIITFLNKVLFESEDFDVNFVSKYDDVTDRFFYFIERIDKYIGTTEVDKYVRRLGKKAKKINELRINSMKEKNIDEILKNGYKTKNNTINNYSKRKYSIDNNLNVDEGSKFDSENENYSKSKNNSFSYDFCESSLENLKFNNKKYSVSQILDPNKNYQLTKMYTTQDSKSNKLKYIWNLYICNILQNFSEMISCNRIISKDELLELKYESFYYCD